MQSTIVKQFYDIGRGYSNEGIISFLDNITNHYDETKDINILQDLFVLVFYTRDIKGRGEKQIFQLMLLYLYRTFPTIIINLLKLIPYYGYHKDYFLLLEMIHENEEYKYLEDGIYNIIWDTINHDMQLLKNEKYNKLSLLAKYIPKEGKKYDKMLKFTDKAVKQLNLMNKKEYRKLITSLNKTILHNFNGISRYWEQKNYEINNTKIDNHKRIRLLLKKLGEEKISLPEIVELVDIEELNIRQKQTIERIYINIMQLPINDKISNYDIFIDFSPSMYSNPLYVAISIALLNKNGKIYTYSAKRKEISLQSNAIDNIKILLNKSYDWDIHHPVDPNSIIQKNSIILTDRYMKLSPQNDYILYWNLRSDILEANNQFIFGYTRNLYNYVVFDIPQKDVIKEVRYIVDDHRYNIIRSIVQNNIK